MNAVGNDAIDLRQGVSAEMPAIDGNDWLELPGMARAPECYAERLPVEHPAYRELKDALAVVRLGKRVEPRYRAKILLEARRLELRIRPPQIVAVEPCLGRDAASKQPAAERSVGKRCDPMLTAIGKDIPLCLTFEKIVGRLRRMERGCSTERIHLRRAEIADPDRSDR